MSVLFLSGFESGDLSEEGVTSGTISVQSTVKRTGNYALKVNPTTNGVGSCRLGSSLSTSTPYMRFYFRADTLPASANEPICVIVLSDYDLQVRISSTGVLSVWFTSALQSTGTTVLSTGTWYRIELSFSSATTQWHLYVNGTQELTGTTNPSEGVFSASLGKYFNENSQSVVFYYDDVCLRDDQLPGAGQIECLLPNGAGSYAQWENPATTSTGTYAQINQVPNDGSTTDIVPSGSNQASTFTFTKPVGSIGSVNCVKWCAIAEEFGSGSLGARFVQGASHADSTILSTLPTSWTAESFYYTTNPVTSAAWTSSDINSIEAGCINGTSTAGYVTALYLMVDYAPASSQTYNETGSGGAIGGSAAIVFADYFPSTSSGAVGNGTGANVYSQVGSGGAVGGGSLVLGIVYSVVGSSGAIVGGSSTTIETVPAIQIGPAPCSCNVFDYTASGGAVGGSEAPQTVVTFNGSGGIVCGSSGIVDVSTQLWDSFCGVYQLQESNGPYVDASIQHNTGTGGDGIDPTTVPGLDVGTCCLDSQLFSGRQFISAPRLKIDRTLTVSAWINLNCWYIDRTFWSLGTNAVDDWQIRFGHSFVRQVKAQVQLLVNDVPTTYTVSGATFLENDRWYRVAATLSATTLSVYVDGKLDGSTTIPDAPFQTSTSGQFIGEWNGGSFPECHLQNLWISGECRSAGWMLAEFQSFCSPDWITVGGIYSPDVG